MKFCLLHEEGKNTDINTEALKERLECWPEEQWLFWWPQQKGTCSSRGKQQFMGRMSGFHRSSERAGGPDSERETGNTGGWSPRSSLLVTEHCPRCGRPNRCPPLCPFALNSRSPRRKPTAGWRKAGCSLMALKRQLTSQEPEDSTGRGRMPALPKP